MKKNVFRNLLICGMASIAVLLVGCGSKAETVGAEAGGGESDQASVASISDELNAALDDLYSVQLNYSNGTAPMNIIPFVTVQTVYDAWDDISDLKDERVPISLREYVDPSVVYLDYATDYSIKWDKDTGDVVVEPTDTVAREDYKQKQHK